MPPVSSEFTGNIKIPVHSHLKIQIIPVTEKSLFHCSGFFWSFTEVIDTLKGLCFSHFLPDNQIILIIL